MRIVHVTRSLDPAAGGLPVVPVRLAAAQAGLGHHVTILAERDAAATPAKPALFAGVPGIVNVHHDWLPPAGVLATLSFAPASPALRSALASADIVHLHGIWAPIIAAAARAARRNNTPYIIAPHGMLDPWSLSQKRWKKLIALRLGWRRILNDAAALHCLNADEERLLSTLGLTARTVIIPNGIFLDEVLPTNALFSDSRPELAETKYILFLSRLHYKKGLDILADAFQMVARSMADVHLVVAGPDDGAKTDFEARIAAAGLTSRVHLVGSLIGPAKWAALRDTTCFCLPSRQEGFSMAILEALASRTAVVISDACHFPEVAEVGAGTTTPLEPAAVAGALQKILGDVDLRRRMGEAGRQLVERRFTWQRAAETSIAAYENARTR